MMIRTCARCGKANADASGTAVETCPSCGVVYNKAELAAAQRKTAAEVRERVRGTSSRSPGIIERAVWGAALLCAGYGMIELLFTLAKAESAPQQGAGAAMAVAWAVIPYCIARAMQSVMRRE